MTKLSSSLPAQDLIAQQVQQSLTEDLGSGDLSAALINSTQTATATIITREPAVLCGAAWATEVYRQLDASVVIEWLATEGQRLAAGSSIAQLTGPARSLLTGERTALNWLQTLSGTATTVFTWQQQLTNTNTCLLDTRKTIPGLRAAQKYAVRCGGGSNHRLGLFDAYLIKENHLISAGSIHNAVTTARQLTPSKTIEVEVESLDELQQALNAKADIILLDNFSLTNIKQAVALTQQRAKLEVSGNIEFELLATLAATGIDYISVGALTKHLRAIDLSMRFSQKSC